MDAVDMAMLPRDMPISGIYVRIPTQFGHHSEAKPATVPT